MIYSFEPFAVDKGKFGQYYNDHCSAVPRDDDWIQLKDYDCMILCPESFKRIADVVEADEGYLIYGAYTNRCAYEEQMIRIPGHDITTHRAHAVSYSKTKGPAIPIERLSGHYLLFKKSYWMLNPIPKKPLMSGRTWDKTFTEGAAGRMALIPGLYVYHQYRLGMRNTKDKSHLR